MSKQVQRAIYKMLSFCVFSTTQYLSWKDEYMKVYEKFISKELDSHPTGVIKVAILDTGIDRNHDLIEGREENIRGKHNLYDPPRKTIKDENGHGTFITSLILDYAPDVELYIIKITGKKNATPAGNVVAQVRRCRIQSKRVTHPSDFYFLGHPICCRRMGRRHYIHVVRVAIRGF